MRSSGVQGRPYSSQVVEALKILLRNEKNVLKVQRMCAEQGNHFSYPYLLGIAKRAKIPLQRGRPCKK